MPESSLLFILHISNSSDVADSKDKIIYSLWIFCDHLFQFFFSHISLSPPWKSLPSELLLSDLSANIQPGQSENPRVHWLFISSLFCDHSCLSKGKVKISRKVWKNPSLVNWFSSFSLYIKQGISYWSTDF